MNTYLTVSSLVNFVTALLLITFLFSSHGSHQSRIKRRYIYLMLSTAGWAGAYFMWRISVTAVEAVFYCKYLMAFALFSPIAFYHFSIDLVAYKPRRMLVAGYVSGCLVAALSFTEYIVAGASAKYGHSFWPDAGSLMWVYLLYFNVYLIASGWMLLKGWRQNVGGRASDCMYVFFTGLVGFIGAGTNFPLWFDLPIQPYGNILVAVYIIILGYGFYSVKISGLQLDLYKVLVGLLLNISATLFYLIVMAMYHVKVGTSLAGGKFWLHVLIGFFSSALIFWGVPKLRFWLERMLDGVFRREQNSALSELKNIPTKLAGLADEQSIAEITSKCLKDTLNVFGVAFYRLIPFESHYRCLHAEGDFFKDTSEYYIDVEDAFIQGLLRKPECLILDQLYADLNEGYYQSLVKIRNDLKVSVIIPVFADHEVLGFLFLGESSQSRVWSEEEESMLFNIGVQIGLNLRTRDLARRSNEVDKLVALGTMAAGLAHEIRNPLVSVQTLASLLRKGKSLDAVSPEFKDVLLRDVKRIANIVEGVALYSQNQNVKKSCIEVQTVVQDSVDICIANSVGSNVEFVFDRLADEEIMVLASFDQLVQVFNNLIENSMHAVEKLETPVIRVSIEKRQMIANRGQSWVEITVSDNGIGVPLAIHDRIFDPFITSKDTGDRVESKGMGLGLAISKRIIENHQGAITLSNNAEGGAKFVVSLQIYDSREINA